MKDRILRIIEEKNLTSSRFADEVGLNRPAVSHILNGRNNPGLEALQRILNRFPDISGTWLITGEGNMYQTHLNNRDNNPTLFDESPEFTATMAIYGREVTKPVMRLYWSALAEYDMPAVRRAFNGWIKNPDAGQFPPKPADIIRMIDGATGDRAMVVWSKVDKAIRMVGHYQSVAFDDAIIHKVLDDMGGWRRIASLPSNKDLEFAGQEFIKRYRAYVLAGGVKEYPAYLIGESEAVNGKNGIRGYDPVQLIGDKDRAAQVARLGSQGPTLRITQARSEELVGQPVAALIGNVVTARRA